MSSCTSNSQQIPYGREAVGPPFVSDSVTSSDASQGSPSPTSEELHALIWNQVWGNRQNQGSSGPETEYAPSELPVQQYSQSLKQQFEARGTSYPQENCFENHSMSQPAHHPAQDHTNYRPPSATHQYGSAPTSVPLSAQEFPYPPVPSQLSPQRTAVTSQTCLGVIHRLQTHQADQTLVADVAQSPVVVRPGLTERQDTPAPPRAGTARLTLAPRERCMLYTSRHNSTREES